MIVTNTIRSLSGCVPKSVRAVGAGAGLSAAAAAVAFLCNILMSRALGPASRGQVAFVLQCAYLVGPILILGVDRTLLRGDAQRDRRVARRHLIVVGALIAVLFTCVFQDWRALAAPIAYATCWMVVIRSNALREHSLSGYVALALAYQGFVLASTVALYFIGVTDWLYWLLPYALPAVVIAAYDIIVDFRGRLRGTFGGVTAMSLRILPSTIANTVMLRVERVILPLAATDAQLGIYVTVATATETLSWLANSLADHRVARFGSAVKGVRGLFVMLLRDALAFAAVAVVVGISIWWMIVPIFGSAFIAGRDLVVPLCIAAVVLALFKQLNARLLASTRPAGVTVASTAGAVVSIPVYIWAIRNWGALGASWACVVVYSVALCTALAMVISQTCTERN